MAFLVVFGNAKNANMCRKDLDDNGGDTNPLGGQEGHLVSKKKKKKASVELQGLSPVVPHRRQVNRK